MKSEPIRILVTGGTFDKEYNELTGELFFQRTHVADMLHDWGGANSRWKSKR